jgi:hypothetical protein
MYCAGKYRLVHNLGFTTRVNVYITEAAQHHANRVKLLFSVQTADCLHSAFPSGAPHSFGDAVIEAASNEKKGNFKTFNVINKL